MEIRPSDSTPSTLLMVAGFMLGLTGVLCTLVSLQFIMWWYVPTLATGVLYGMTALGLTTITLGWFTSDGRLWAAILGAAIAPLVGVVSLGWALWSVTNLSFTLFMFLTPPVAMFATFIMPFAIPAAIRCRKARAMMQTAEGSMFGV